VKEGILSYLDRFVTVIGEPMDVVRVFAPLSRGQQHNLDRGLRALFNFLEAQGYPKVFLDAFRKNIPRVEGGIDLKVPSEERVMDSLRKMVHCYPNYNAVYNLILDSGLRLIESCRLVNSLGSVELERLQGFVVAPLGYFRETKLAYFGFFTERTLQLLRKVKGSVNELNVSGYRHKHRDVVAYKYLRKFAFDKMIELEIPESVADFIQGRTPKSVGAKHYMVLVRQAKKFYPRYAQYVEELRQKALN